MSCLPDHYVDLWQSTFDSAIREDAFTWESEPTDDPGIPPERRTLPWDRLTLGCSI
jgi:hypothetical protein